MLQSSFFDPVVGLDIHLVLVPTPAGPVPTPVPQPFVGLVRDFMGLAVGTAVGMALGSGPGVVLVNCLPVTNGGTAVTNLPILPHLPAPGVAFARGRPHNDAELIFGSKDVSLGGSLGVRLGDIALSCSDPVRLPTSLVLAIPKGPPVLNGAAMVLDVKGMAQRALFLAGFKALGAAFRAGARIWRMLRTVQRRSHGWERVSSALRRAVDRLAPQRLRDRLKRVVCFLTGHPVDVATGRVLTDNIDFELPGPLPLVFERVYSSSLSWRGGPLGYGWSHSLHQEVWAERGKVVYLAEDGREIEFATDHLPGRTLRRGQFLFDATNCLLLHALEEGHWELEAEDGRVHRFAPVAGAPPGRSRLVHIRSRDGHHIIRLEYDEQGLLSLVHDSAGRLIRFEHDSQGRLSEVRLPQAEEAGWGRHLSYRYSEQGDLVEVVDALGHSWRYDYQGHLLVQETGRTGLSFYFQYDGIGSGARCVRTWGDGGIFDHVLTYDLRNRRTLVEDSLGHATLYQVDELGMVVKVVDPHGAATRYTYDEDCGKLARQVDALGHAHATTYDERGKPVALQGPDGLLFQLEYDGKSLPVRMRDALGGVWTWAYDSEGHLVEETGPTGERRTWGWRQGLIAWAETPGGRRTFFEYDQHKNMCRTRAPDGSITEHGYDGQGRPVWLKDARGAMLRCRYDALGRVLRLESPAGTVQEMAYDAVGNLLEVRSPTRHVRFRYGQFHKLVAREEAGTAVRFTYDKEDRLTGVINEALEEYTYVLDACGRVREETGFDGRKYRYERNIAGQLTRKYFPSGRMSSLEYDAAGRVSKVSHSDGTGVEFEYRADGALVRARNESMVVVFERDALGRVVREVQGDFSVSSRLGAEGERVLLETSLGGRMAVQRDALGQVSELRLGQDSPRDSLTTIGFERDVLGLEAARLLPGDIRVEWQRDMAGRPLLRRTLRHGVRGRVDSLESRTYQWRGEDQIAATVDANGVPTLYQHDARGRLVSQRTGAELLYRAMDAVGNVYRTPELTGRRYGRGGRLEQAGGVRYVHDEDGNQVERVEADGRTWRYHWNGAGLLSEVERPDGLRVRFEYDAFARRTRKALVRLREDGDEAVESEVRFVWDGNTLLHELSPVAEAITWYWDPDSLTPVAREVGTRRWTLAVDHLGAPTEMYDEWGQLAWRMQLDVWGVGRVDTALQYCPWRWPGQYEDKETGFYYNRFRYYDSNLGRYICRDPMGLAGGVHLFWYVLDPLTAVDLLGLSEFCIYFGQKRVAPQFQSQGEAPEYIWGRKLLDVAEDIKAGRLSADEILIQYFKDTNTGLWVAVNNRGLATLALAGKRPTLIEEVTPKTKQLNRLFEPPLLKRTKIPGPRIPVTEDEAGMKKLYIVDLFEGYLSL